MPKQSVSVSINAVRAALSSTEYRTARDVMSTTGYSYSTVHNALTMLEYREEIEGRTRFKTSGEMRGNDTHEYRII